MNPAIKDRHSPRTPEGRPKKAWTAVLEQGSNLLQEVTPLRGFDVYVVGFHCGKDQPDMQMEAHHYCRVVNEDFLQCVVFDGNTKQANLIGIEYIVTGDLYGSLPEEERSLWHPHNFEVLSGQLAAPGLPEPAETAPMERLLNSYGKTWHTWHTGRHDGEPGDALPLGQPALMWSFNREGECDESLAADRNEAMELDTVRRRLARERLRGSARPQAGVDAMDGQFHGPTTPVPGVVDARSRE